MVEVLFTSSVLILALVLLRQLLRGKISLRLQYALWLLAAVRLLVPVSIGSSPLSILNAAPAAGKVDSLYLSPVRESLTPADGSQRPVTMYDYRPAQLGPSSPDNTFTYVDSYDVSHEVEYERQIDLINLLRPIWCAGIAATALWFLAVNGAFRRRLRKTAVPLEVSDCPLPVFVAEGIPSPCLAGLFRPAIYVTPACLEDEDRLRHVLAHELIHWRHRDPFWSLVRCACLCVYWFHPLVWLAASLSRRDCELACDEGALSTLGEGERTAYGRTLIGLMAVSSSPSHLLQTATTMVDRKQGVKERLTLIAQKPKMLAVTAVAVALIAVAAAACTFTGAEAPEESQPNAAPVSNTDPAPSSPDTSPAVSDSKPGRYATVEEALADMPTEFGQAEESYLLGVTAYTPENGSEYFDLHENEIFRGYWTAYLALSSSLTNPWGWLGSVYRLDKAGSASFTAPSRPAATETCWECFAADETWYYVLCFPSPAPELRSDLTDGARLQENMLAWVKEAVLSVEGMEASGFVLDDSASAPMDIMEQYDEEELRQLLEQSLNPKTISYVQNAGRYDILGYDAAMLSWMPPDNVIPAGDLYFVCPRFLDPFFRDIVVEGSAGLLDGTVTVSFTVDANDPDSGTVTGPTVRFSVDADGVLLERSFGKWNGETVSLTDAQMISIASQLRKIINDVQTYISMDFGSLSDDALMYNLLNQYDGAYAEGAQYELGERFLARPGDILNTMTWYIGVQPQHWPDDDWDGADWLVNMLVSEFAVMRGGEDAERFLSTLDHFSDEDCGGMARDVREAWWKCLVSNHIHTDTLTVMARRAYADLLAGETALLAQGDQERAWADFHLSWDQLEYALLDLDGDGVPELLFQGAGNDPAATSAIFHYTGGGITCWHFDYMDGSDFQYPLQDGTMVREFHFGGASTYTLFRYYAQGTMLTTDSFGYVPADSGEPEYYTYNGEAVTQETFQRLFTEKITAQWLDTAVWTNAGTEETL